MKKVINVLLMVTMILSSFSIIKAEDSLFVIENDRINFEEGTGESIGVNFYGSEDQIDYIKINGRNAEIGGQVVFTDNTDYIYIQARTNRADYHSVYVENQNEMIIGYHVNEESYEYLFNFYISHCDYAPTVSADVNTWMSGDDDIFIYTDGILENAYVYISKTEYFAELKQGETVDEEKINVNYSKGTVRLFSSYLSTLAPGIYYVTVGWNGCFHSISLQILSGESEPVVSVSSNIWYPSRDDIVIKTDKSLETYEFSIQFYSQSGCIFDYYSMDGKALADYDNNEIVILSSFLETLDEGDYFFDLNRQDIHTDIL